MLGTAAKRPKSARLADWEIWCLARWCSATSVKSTPCPKIEAKFVITLITLHKSIVAPLCWYNAYRVLQQEHRKELPVLSYPSVLHEWQGSGRTVDRLHVGFLSVKEDVFLPWFTEDRHG
ncbi:unnamed protein product [Durusdinium trenchii]|uniref:Uncharacterized protein n=1 Tax=Durusdinium trenchii TaxID=1381693 RepID=A0ABP0NLL4_9DINO